MKILLILFQALMLITFAFLLFFAAVYAGRKRKEKKKENKRKEQRQIRMTIVQKYQSEYFTVQKLCDKAMDEQLLFELN